MERYIVGETEYDTEPETEPESEPETEFELETKSNDKILKLVNFLSCYFTRDLAPLNLNLICYYCSKKSYPMNIVHYSSRCVENSIVYDVPTCPYCHMDAIIDLSKLRKTKMNETFLLNAMRKKMFE